jgi:hypothetical protein
VQQPQPGRNKRPGFFVSLGLKTQAIKEKQYSHSLLALKGQRIKNNPCLPGPEGPGNTEAQQQE